MNDARKSDAETDLVLGIDGGGSQTLAWLARVVDDTDDDPVVIGRGTSGSSNARAIGIDLATRHLDQAIERAFVDANISRASVPCACMGLAGADRDEEQTLIRSWADQRRIAKALILTNDAMPVLHACSGTSPGIALIAGTGSFCLGRSPSGQVTRCGGWGYLLGDEGSGYWIAMEGLRAVTRAIDGKDEATELHPLLFSELGISKSPELITTIYGETHDRSKMAKLAPIVFQAAEKGDRVASAIVQRAIEALCDLVVSTWRRLELAESISIGLTGGVLLNQPAMFDGVTQGIAKAGVDTQSVTRVDWPVAGAVAMADVYRRETKR